VAYSVPDVVLFCDLQFSSDGVGFCISNLKLDNSTEIARMKDFASRGSTYQVNGQDVQGWFSVDFKSEELHQIGCKQKTTFVYLENSDRNFFKVVLYCAP
jgi:hypothetical protein